MLETCDGKELASIYRKFIMFSAQFLDKDVSGELQVSLCMAGRCFDVWLVGFGWFLFVVFFPRRDLADV